MPGFCCLLLTKAAKTTPAATSMMMIDASALKSGVTPSLTFEKINIGKVVAPGRIQNLRLPHRPMKA